MSTPLCTEKKKAMLCVGGLVPKWILCVGWCCAKLNKYQCCLLWFFFCLFSSSFGNNSTQGDSDLPQKVFASCNKQNRQADTKRVFIKESAGQDPRAACGPHAALSAPSMEQVLCASNLLPDSCPTNRQVGYGEEFTQ